MIVRLDKLLTNLPGDPSKRREHEQRVVAWAEGSFVPACPACTRSFTPVRRRHHCRLCGAVMCQVQYYRISHPHFIPTVDWFWFL